MGKISEVQLGLISTSILDVVILIVFFLQLEPVWEFCWLLAFVNFITLVILWWFGQFISSRQWFLAIKLIAFLYISNSMCTGVSIMEFPDWVQVKVEAPWRNQLSVTGRNQTGPESGPKLGLFFCSHENRTVRYCIVPVSGSLFRTAQFLDLFWNGPLDFFRTCVNATPLRTTFWNGTISYPCEQGLS